MGILVVAFQLSFKIFFQELQACFESQDIELLKETIAKMDPEEAAKHMKRCVDSGLWVPDKNQKENGSDENVEGES